MLVDFHHTSLLTSLNLLFRDRLGFEVYRPTGMEWFHEGFWAINDLEPTARQFLEDVQPEDGTPSLNVGTRLEDGIVTVLDPGHWNMHKAMTFERFLDEEFDYILCSIPQHIPVYLKLLQAFQPKAKFIVQMGNEWPWLYDQGYNVLASTMPRPGEHASNVCWYHQEFDLRIFTPSLLPIGHDPPVISSFVNVITDKPQAMTDFHAMSRAAATELWDCKAFGGQCPDGNMEGPMQLARQMHRSRAVLHSKDGGDGYGHIIHNAFATGSAVICRPSQYAGQLASLLMTEETCWSLDRLDPLSIVKDLTLDNVLLRGVAAYDRFRNIVSFSDDADRVQGWLSTLS